jgi:hypothetical protein
LRLFSTYRQLLCANTNSAEEEILAAEIVYICRRQRTSGVRQLLFAF